MNRVLVETKITAKSLVDLFIKLQKVSPEFVKQLQRSKAKKFKLTFEMKVEET